VVYLTDDVIKSGMTSLKVGEAQSKSRFPWVQLQQWCLFIVAVDERRAITITSTMNHQNEREFDLAERELRNMVSKSKLFPSNAVQLVPPLPR